MAVPCENNLEQALSAAAKEMDKHRWMTPRAAMEQAVSGAQGEPWSPILLELASLLGKYDMDSQLLAVDAARHRTEDALFTLEQERKQRAKTYEVLGVCAGLSLVILLI